MTDKVKTFRSHVEVEMTEVKPTGIDTKSDYERLYYNHHTPLRKSFTQPEVETVSITRSVTLLLVFYLAKIREWKAENIPMKRLHFNFTDEEGAMSDQAHVDTVTILLLELVRPELGLFIYAPATDEYNVCIQDERMPFWKAELYQLFAHLLYLSFIDGHPLPFQFQLLFWMNVCDEDLEQLRYTRYTPAVVAPVEHVQEQSIGTNTEVATLYFNAPSDGPLPVDQFTYWKTIVDQVGHICKTSEESRIVNTWLAEVREENERDEALSKSVSRYIPLSSEVDPGRIVLTESDKIEYSHLNSNLHLKTGRAGAIAIIRSLFPFEQDEGQQVINTPGKSPLNKNQLTNILERNSQVDEGQVEVLFDYGERDQDACDHLNEAIQYLTPIERRHVLVWVNASHAISRFYCCDPLSLRFSFDIKTRRLPLPKQDCTLTITRVFTNLKTPEKIERDNTLTFQIV